MSNHGKSCWIQFQSNDKKKLSEIFFSDEENHYSDIESDEDNYDCDDNIDDWDETEEGEEEPTQCLFCDKMCTTIDEAVEHLSVGHRIDLSILKGKFHMDQYSYIKVGLKWLETSLNIFIADLIVDIFLDDKLHKI